MKVIYQGTVGSKMHGLSTPQSDDDLRYITLSPLISIISPFSNNEVKVSGANGEDVESWELRHFVKHLTSGNPTMYEVIRTPLYNSTEWTEKFRGMLPSFLNSKGIKNAHIGYAEAQLKRYLRPGSGMDKMDPNWGKEISKSARDTYRVLAQGPKSKQSGSNKSIMDPSFTKRIPKATVAAYRVLAQGRQLVEKGTFCPHIADYSPELHKQLMELKTMSPTLIDKGFCKEHLDEIELQIQGFKAFCENVAFLWEPDYEAIDKFLLETYTTKGN